MTITDVRSKLIPGTRFSFNLPGHVTNLEVVSNDGAMLIANIVDGGGKQMTWSLVGLDEIHGLSLG